MPISLTPFMIAGVSLLLLVAGTFGVFSMDDSRRKQARVAIVLGLCGFLLPPATMLAIRQVLWCGASLGSPYCQFTYSRFLESTPGIMQKLSFVPFDFHFDDSWYWLNRAADSGHIEARYAVGNRIKHDRFVPYGAGLSSEGQALMDSAIDRGFQLKYPEHQYYSGQFRMHLWFRF